MDVVFCQEGSTHTAWEFMIVLQYVENGFGIRLYALVEGIPAGLPGLWTWARRSRYHGYEGGALLGFLRHVTRFVNACL